MFRKKRNKKIKLFSAKVLFSDILNTWTDKSFHLTKKAPIDLLVLIISFFSWYMFRNCSWGLHVFCRQKNDSNSKKSSQLNQYKLNLLFNSFLWIILFLQITHFYFSHYIQKEKYMHLPMHVLFLPKFNKNCIFVQKFLNFFKFILQTFQIMIYLILYMNITAIFKCKQYKNKFLPIICFR